MKSFTDYRLPSTSALLAFQTAAQAGSFEMAAQMLSLTVSATRKRIAGLEQFVGFALFDRLRGNLLLTPQGQLYLEQITQVLTQLAAIAAHQRPAQRRRLLTLSCPPTFARQILVPRLQEHSLAYPDIDLQIELSAPLAHEDSSTSDVHICGSSPDVEPSQRLLDERLQPMAAPALLARYPGVQLPEDFSRLPLLRSPLEPWQPWFFQAGLNLPEPNQGPALLDLGMMLEAAIQAHGVILTRPSLAKAWLDDGRLVAVGKVRSEPSYHYQLRVLQVSPQAREFGHWLKQICREALSQAENQLRHSPAGK